METYEINCPHCNTALEVEKKWENMQVNCPACDKEFVIPPKPKATGPSIKLASSKINNKTTTQEEPKELIPPTPPKKPIKDLLPDPKSFIGIIWIIVAIVIFKCRFLANQFQDNISLYIPVLPLLILLILVFKTKNKLGEKFINKSTNKKTINCNKI